MGNGRYSRGSDIKRTTKLFGDIFYFAKHSAWFAEVQHDDEDVELVLAGNKAGPFPGVEMAAKKTLENLSEILSRCEAPLNESARQMDFTDSRLEWCLESLQFLNGEDPEHVEARFYLDGDHLYQWIVEIAGQKPASVKMV